MRGKYRRKFKFLPSDHLNWLCLTNSDGQVLVTTAVEYLFCRTRSIRAVIDLPLVSTAITVATTSTSIPTTTSSTRCVVGSTTTPSSVISEPRVSSPTTNVGQFKELRIDSLRCFSQDTDQISGLLAVVPSEKCVSRSCVIPSAGSSDTMDVVLRTVRIIKIDNELDVINI